MYPRPPVAQLDELGSPSTRELRDARQHLIWTPRRLQAPKACSPGATSADATAAVIAAAEGLEHPLEACAHSFSGCGAARLCTRQIFHGTRLMIPPLTSCLRSCCAIAVSRGRRSRPGHEGGLLVHDPLLTSTFRNDVHVELLRDSYPIRIGSE